VSQEPAYQTYVHVHRRHLVNTTDRSVRGGDATLCQITITIFVYFSHNCDALDNSTDIALSRRAVL